MATIPTINLNGNLPPEILGQQQQLNRQQQMAQMLMQQGQQMPSGQMVSGRFVAPSFFQYAAPLFQTYAGKSLAEEGDKKALELAAALRKQYANELSQYQDLMNPRQTEMAGPTPTGAPLMSNAPDRQAANLFAASAYNPALQAVGMKNLTQGPKWEKASFTDEKSGKTREGVIDVNSPDPISTFQVGGVKPEMSAYERASLQFKAGDQAISRANLYYNTGMGAGGGGVPTGAPVGAPMVNAPVGAPMVNAPVGAPMVNAPVGAPVSNVPAGAPVSNVPAVPAANVPAQPQKSNFTPAVQPQYQYNPALSPKANQEAAAKFSEELSKNQRNAKDSFDLMKSASILLSSEAPSSGRLSNIVTGTREFFGGGGEASKADAQLNLLSGALTMKQPRFEGPQGVMDVILYQKLAGDLGNANIPIASRLATINQMIDLQKKYYPEGDWDSISTKTQSATKTEAAKSAGKVSVGAPQYARNPTTGERIVSTDGGINWKPVGGK
jgi:hypothetical protein